MASYTIKYFTKNLPCTEEEIQALEQEIGILLLPEHKDVLLQANGLLVFYNSLLGADGFEWAVAGIFSKEEIASWVSWAREDVFGYAKTKGKDLFLIPFAKGLGSSLYFLSYAPETYGEIWEMDSAGDVHFLAKDFATFWAGVRWADYDEGKNLPDEAYPYNLPPSLLHSSKI